MEKISKQVSRKKDTGQSTLALISSFHQNIWPRQPHFPDLRRIFHSSLRLYNPHLVTSDFLFLKHSMHIYIQLIT